MFDDICIVIKSSGNTGSSMYAVKWTIAWAVLGIVVDKFSEDFRTWFKNAYLLVWGAADSENEEVAKLISLALAIAWDIAAFNSSLMLEYALPKFVFETKACSLNRGSKIVLILKEKFFFLLIKVWILGFQFIYFFNFCFQSHLLFKFIILKMILLLTQKLYEFRTAAFFLLSIFQVCYENWEQLEL